MTEVFSVEIEPEAVEDIQNAIDYYNHQKTGLGKRFFNTIDKHFSFLKKNYLAFHVKYDKIRCMPVQNFPYMIHYQVKEKDEKVSIKAVFSTYENPDKWEKRIR